jgi:hypothetical protein
MTVTATEHTTPSEALQYLDAAGHDVAFSVGGRVFSARQGEYDRLEAAGVQPTTWHDYHGRIVSVPGRNG